MNKFLQSVLFTAVSAAFAPAMAQTATQAAPAKPAPAKKTVKPKAAETPAKEVPAAAKSATIEEEDEESKVPDTGASTVTEYKCEFNTTITVFQNPGDNDYIAMRWSPEAAHKKGTPAPSKAEQADRKLLPFRMKRVSTSTGADRFENKRYGLVWIAIPSKGMLLDSKKGQQLANECRTPQQLEKHNAPKG